MSDTSSFDQRICVTGANGYIGSHVVREFLARGYRVKATVRDIQDPSRTQHLQHLSGSERLELASADVLKASGWEEVLKDCDCLVHCAAAVKMAAREPQRDIVDVAVEGTRNVLLAASQSERTKRVVQLSSVAAMISYDKPPEYQFGADDWCDDATLSTNPYGLAKTRSERLAWELSKAGQDGHGFSMVAINPAVVFGPVLAKSHGEASVRVVLDILQRTFPGCPAISFSVIDVRDVAQGCVSAAEKPELSGRYCLSADRLWWREIATELNQLLPEARFRTNRLPSALVYLAGVFDSRVNVPFLRRILNRETRLDGLAALAPLQMNYRPLQETLLDSVHSFQQVGLIKEVPGNVTG